MTASSLPRRDPAPVTFRRRDVPGVPQLDRMTRYRGGTYSHTVATLVFTDGSTARTDLIRLNPNVEAYSLDFCAAAPTRPSHYRADTWTALPNAAARAHEPEVDWILRNSFPTVGTAELSVRLRAAGYPLGAGNVAEHEAIAATQAAIWSFTNNLDLDVRPRNVPAVERHDDDAVVVRFDSAPQLGGYEVEVDVEDATSTGDTTVRLQRSVDGTHWEDVATSGLTVTGSGSYRKALGVGSTLSSHRPGRRQRGYHHYRAVSAGPAKITSLQFRLDGESHFSNPDRIVHLYAYLLAGARWARRHAVAPELSTIGATEDDGIVGPIRLHASHVARLQVSAGSLIDADGLTVRECSPGAEFYLLPAPGARSVTLTATVPARADGFGGRVVTGVARDEVNSRLTPVALAVPAPLAVEFEVQWTPRTTRRSRLRAVKA